MKGKVSEIWIKYQKGLDRISVNQGVFIEKKGIEGDIYADGGERQVAIIDKELKDSMSDSEIGFCIKKFKENMAIRDLDFKILKIKELLKVGEAELEISEVGKMCFKDCPNLTSKTPCPMKTGCVFAKVRKSGVIALGDTVEVIHF